MKRLPLQLGLLVAVSTANALAGDWPQWRGPDRTGVTAESGWIDTWPADGPPVSWRAKVGLGFASFVVADGRVFTTGHADETDTVFCLDAETGEIRWRHSYPAQLGDKYFEGGTTGTPTVSGGRVYTLSRWGDAFCLDAGTGKVIWSRQVQKETGARIPDWGFGGAPLVSGDRVFLNVGESGLALNANTGEPVWQSAPKSSGYSTPLPIRFGGEDLLILGSAEAYVAVTPGSGKEVWRIKWLTEYGVNASDPVVQGDELFLSTGYGKGGALFDLKSGTPVQRWKTKALRTQMNAAVLHAGHLYGVDGDTTGKAALKCLELATGSEKWSQSGFGSGSVIVADGRLIALGGAGELFIAPASPKGFEPTTRAQVLGGKCWTTPVLAHGRLLIRNARGDVQCLDLRKK